MKLIVIGAGNMGRKHATILHQLGYLSGIVDVDMRKARKLAQLYGVDYAASPDELDFDGAIVATPTDTHFEISRRLIKRGKHLLIEKPMTSEIKHARKLAKLAEKQKVILAVGHVERFNPIVNFFKKYAKRGNSICARRIGPFPKTVTTGVILDLAIHDIDILLYLFGRPKRVLSSGDKENERFASIFIEFMKDRYGYIEVSWLSPIKDRRLWMLGDGVVVYGNYMLQEVEVFDGRKTKKIKWKRNALREELLDFINAIRNNGKPTVSAKEGISALKVAIAATKSLESGKVVRVRW